MAKSVNVLTIYTGKPTRYYALDFTSYLNIAIKNAIQAVECVSEVILDERGLFKVSINEKNSLKWFHVEDVFYKIIGKDLKTPVYFEHVNLDEDQIDQAYRNGQIRNNVYRKI
jgi:hypothetical protein